MNIILSQLTHFDIRQFIFFGFCHHPADLFFQQYTFDTTLIGHAHMYNSIKPFAPVAPVAPAAPV